MAKVWIATEIKGLFEIKQVDAKKLVQHDWSPKGMARLIKRAPTRHKPDGVWEYVYYGDTREEVCLKANRFHLEKIAKLEKELAEIKARLAV